MRRNRDRGVLSRLRSAPTGLRRVVTLVMIQPVTITIPRRWVIIAVGIVLAVVVLSLIWFALQTVGSHGHGP